MPDAMSGATASAPPRLRPVSMEEAVGYPAIDCANQSLTDDHLITKHNRLFLLSDEHGDISPPGCCSLGLFHDDTRILSHSALRVPGGAPLLLSARTTDIFRAQVDLAVTDRGFGGDSWDPKNAVHLRRVQLLNDRLTEQLTVTNFLPRPVPFWIELQLGCDFADIFEVRGWKRADRGQFYAPVAGTDTICFAYRGRDGALQRVEVRFDRPPDSLDRRQARWDLTLQPNQPLQLEWEVRALPLGEGDVPPLPRKESPRQAYRAWERECTDWRSDEEVFNRVLGQARTDLRGLYVELDGAEVISAGIPWYSTVFGRDSIITSLQTLALNPRIARDTLRYLARHQGAEEDPYTEEQPGKILHELRRGELARSGEIPHVPYYGTIDATPLWLVLLHETWRWTGDDALVQELLPHAERALHWIDRFGDPDGDGLLEYARTSAKGLVNQGWKDSGDGVPFPDGTLPEPPIALVEVQGYAHDAKVRMAALFEHLGEPERAAALRGEAERLLRAIRERFWMEEEGTFALALDGEKRPIPTVTSNAGHLLWSRVPTPEQADRMQQRLLRDDMFSGWGMRTLSAEHPVYNPMSYHDGSVWPHDNGIVALGFALYNRTDAAVKLFAALHDVGVGMADHRLPELFCGMARGVTRSPVQYPVSCSPQAWASGAMFMLLQAMCGILPDAPGGTLHIRQPRLPPALRRLRVDGLRVGDTRVELEFLRRGERTVANLLNAEGAPLKIVTEES